MISLPSKKIKTKNIANSISKFAAEHLLQPDEYTFSLNGVETYIKTTANDDFVLYKEDIHNYYKDRNKLINEHVRFKQLYVITIKKETNPIIKLNYDINFSDNNVTPHIIIHPDSLIPYKKYKAKDIYILLLKELNNIKALNKILVQIFDTKMKEKLKAFVKYLYQNKFVKKIRIPLFDGIEPEITRTSKLVKHYLKKENNAQVIEVEVGEVLVEYIKPIYGKNGLDAFGEIIRYDYGNNQEDLHVEVDLDSIEIEENDNHKLYKSKIKGFVYLDDKKFYVDNRIKMKRLSRVQEKVAKDEDNNIEVLIEQHDTNIDSLGEGVELTSETIHIKGHVGAKTKLAATNLVIDGATHGDSYQEARIAEINRHKGKLRCQKAKIKLLEGGEVYATDVDVEAALGGAIYAENVTIRNVKNNLKIYASKSITIHKVSGEDNLFKINYKDVPTLNAKYKFLTNDIEDLKFKLEGAMKHSKKLIKPLKEKIKELQNQQKQIQNSAFEAKITIEEPLNGLNTITFTISDDDELIYKTDARRYKPFYLEKTDTTITLHPTDKKISLDS